MALSQTSSSRMTCALMEPQPVILESQNAMNAVDGATIERKIRINRPDEGRGRCKGSRAWDPRKDFSRCKQQQKIPSTSNVILPQQERTEPSGHWSSRHGVKSSLRREPDVPGDLLRATLGNVTEPGGCIGSSPVCAKACDTVAAGATVPAAAMNSRRSMGFSSLFKLVPLLWP